MRVCHHCLDVKWKMLPKRGKMFNYMIFYNSENSSIKHSQFPYFLDKFKFLVNPRWRRVGWRHKSQQHHNWYQPSGSADKTNLGLDNFRYHTQPHSIIVLLDISSTNSSFQAKHCILFFSFLFFIFLYAWNRLAVSRNCSLKRGDSSLKKSGLASWNIECRNHNIWLCKIYNDINLPWKSRPLPASSTAVVLGIYSAKIDFRLLFSAILQKKKKNIMTYDFLHWCGWKTPS